MVGHNFLEARELTSGDIFPIDRVLDVQITVDAKDWDTIRLQSRNIFEALQERRQHAPLDHPYTYVEASVSIDGVEFPQVGIRKKGFIGSQNSIRPSLKIKLNHIDKDRRIDGLTNLTFNNNQSDVSLISQFIGFGLFNFIKTIFSQTKHFCTLLYQLFLVLVSRFCINKICLEILEIAT